MITLRNKIEAVHDEGCDVKIPTLGFSMYPVIKTGDKITIQKIEVESLKKGDIIGVVCGDKVVFHRLVRIHHKYGETVYQTRGDTHFRKNSPVRLEQLMGKVTWIDRRGNTNRLRKFLLPLTPLLIKNNLLNAAVVGTLLKLQGWWKILAR